MFHRNTKFITIATTLFFLLGVSVFSVFFFIVTKQKAHFHEKSVERAEIQAHQDSLTALMRTLGDTENERISLRTRIVPDEDVVDILALIESLGKEQGVILTTNSLTVAPINNLFETLVINVSVEGSYQSIIHTLKLLEHLPYQSEVGKVQMENQQGMKWNGAVEVRVTKFKKI